MFSPNEFATEARSLLDDCEAFLQKNFHATARESSDDSDHDCVPVDTGLLPLLDIPLPTIKPPVVRVREFVDSMTSHSRSPSTGNHDGKKEKSERVKAERINWKESASALSNEIEREFNYRNRLRDPQNSAESDSEVFPSFEAHNLAVTEIPSAQGSFKQLLRLCVPVGYDHLQLYQQHRHSQPRRVAATSHAPPTPPRCRIYLEVFRRPAMSYLTLSHLLPAKPGLQERVNSISCSSTTNQKERTQQNETTCVFQQHTLPTAHPSNSQQDQNNRYELMQRWIVDSRTPLEEVLMGNNKNGSEVEEGKNKKRQRDGVSTSGGENRGLKGSRSLVSSTRSVHHGCPSYLLPFGSSDINSMLYLGHRFYVNHVDRHQKEDEPSGADSDPRQDYSAPIRAMSIPVSTPLLLAQSTQRTSSHNTAAATISEVRNADEGNTVHHVLPWAKCPVIPYRREDDSDTTWGDVKVRLHEQGLFRHNGMCDLLISVVGCELMPKDETQISASLNTTSSFDDEGRHLPPVCKYVKPSVPVRCCICQTHPATVLSFDGNLTTNAQREAKGPVCLCVRCVNLVYPPPAADSNSHLRIDLPYGRYF